MLKVAESNIGIRDWCIACGHYHIPTSWEKQKRQCVVHTADAEACSCTPKKFTPRSHKRFA